MAKNSLKNYSLVEIESCIAKALGDLTGCDVRVTIAGITHPVPDVVAIWNGPAPWRAEFSATVAEVLPPDVVDDVPFL